MNLTDNLKSYWKYLEKRNAPPTHVSSIHILEFDKLKSAINDKNIFYLKNLVRKMYSGDAYILRKAAKKSLKKIIIELAKHYDRKQKSSFHKMLDSAPNFHRIIDRNNMIKFKFLESHYRHIMYSNSGH